MKVWYDIATKNQLLGYRVFNNLFASSLDELNQRLEVLKGLNQDDVLVDIWFPIAVFANSENGEQELVGVEPCNYSVFFSELDKLNEQNCPYWDAKSLSSLVSGYFEDNQNRDNWKENEIDEIYFVPVADLKAQIENIIAKLRYSDNSHVEESITQQDLECVELLAYLQSHIPIYRVSYRMSCVAKAVLPLVYDGAISTFALSLNSKEQEDAFLSYLSLRGAKVDAHIQGGYPKEIVWVVCESRNGRIHYLCPLTYIKKQAELIFNDYADKESICYWSESGVPSPVIQDALYGFI